MDPNFTVVLIGSVILLGVFLKHFSKKTGWPLSLILLLIGLLIGPVFGIFDANQFSGAIHSFAIIALVLVIFDTGYEIKLNQIKQTLFESTGLAFIGVISTLFVVFLIARYLMGLNPYLSLLFGALLASTDLTIIAPLMETIKINKKTKEALELEATLNSVLAAIVAIIAATIITYNTSLIEAISRGLFYHVLSGIAIGLMLGWILLKSMHYLNIEDMPAIVTIGAVLVVYAVTEMIGASGVIAALIVGLLYGNVKPAPPKFVMLFGDNLQMILVTFVYIFLGAMITFSAFTSSILIVIALISAIVLIRYFSVKLVMLNESLLAQRIVGIAGPRGIISAILVLSYAPYFPNPDLIIGLCFAVIFCTSLMVFLLPLIEQKTKNSGKFSGFRF
jgi:NhaP-type Na+/H+ or K+/H+ antiporter